MEQTARRLIRRVDPVHPEGAKNQTGVVLVGFYIDPDGIPIFVQALTGPKVFHKAAIAAVTQWRYRVPYAGTTTIGRANVRFDGHSELILRVRQYDKEYQGAQEAFRKTDFLLAHKHLSAALELSEAFPPDYDEAKLQTLSQLIPVSVQIGRYDEAETLGLRLLNFVEQKPVASAEIPGMAIALVATAYMRKMQLQKAAAFLDRAIPFIEQANSRANGTRVMGLHSQTLCIVVLQRASLYLAEGKYEEAERAYERAAGMIPELPLPAVTTSMFTPFLARLRVTGRNEFAIRLEEWLTEVRVNAQARDFIPPPPSFSR